MSQLSTIFAHSTNLRSGPLFLSRACALPRLQRFPHTRRPLRLRAQYSRARPIQHRPQLLVRILDRGAGEPEAHLASEPAIGFGDARARILELVRFVDEDAGPREGVEEVDVASGGIKRRYYWGREL